MNEIIILILIAIIGIAMGVGIYFYMKMEQEDDSNYQQQDRVLVQNGVNIKEVVLNMQNGNYFAGNYEAETTQIGVKHNIVWEIQFLNLRNNQSKTFSFYNRIWIGRKPYHNEATLILNDDHMVSKTHCMIYEIDGRLAIRDMESTNHTYVNGAKVEESMYLENNAILKVGNSNFRIYFARKNL